MKALRWWARRLLDRLGWAGIAGGLLLTGSAALYAAAVHPAASRLSQLEEREDLLRARLAETEGGARLPAAATLRFAAEPAEALAGLQGAAQEVGLFLEQGEYRLATDRNASLLRYRMTLPVTGAYPQIRAFIDRALDGATPLALEEVSFRRDRIDAPRVEARLTFTLLLEAR